ncbi:MAG: hypothetical protein ACE5K1_05490 [Acidiferrobacterales bacterium]
MTNLITGLIAALLVVVFLGYYAVMIGSIPLWIIIIVIVAVVLIELVQALRQGGNRTRD